MSDNYYIDIGGIASYQADTVYFCYGENGGVKLKYTFNGGNNWDEINIATAISSLMYFLNSHTAYISTSYYGKSVDNPYSLWRVDSLVPRLITDSLEYRIMQMRFTDTLNGYSIQNISYPNYGLFSTHNGGRSWTLMQSQLDPSASICFTSQNNGYISSGMSLYRTTDGGVSIAELSTPNQSKITMVYCTNDSTIYCVGDNGEYMVSSDYGTNWSLEIMPSHSQLKQIQMFEDGHGYITNANHMLYSNMLVESLPEVLATTICIYPNPSKDLISIKGAVGIKYKRIEIYNLEGILMITSFNSNNIDVSKLAPGMYIVSVIMDSMVKNVKFIKE